MEGAGREGEGVCLGDKGGQDSGVAVALVDSSVEIRVSDIVVSPSRCAKQLTSMLITYQCTLRLLGPILCKRIVQISVVALSPRLSINWTYVAPRARSKTL